MVATVKVCKYTTRYTRPIDTKVTWDGLQWDIYIYIYIYICTCTVRLGTVVTM